MSLANIMQEEKENCCICGKELKELEEDVCASCYRLMRMKYPKTKCLEEQIKCHKRNTKRKR